jgi:hypothetical protein
MSYAWSSTNARTSTVDSLAISSLDADADAELVLRQPSASLDFEADLVSGSSTAGVVVRVGTRYAKVGVRGTEMVHDVHGKISTSLLDTSSPAQVTLFIKARAGGYDLGVRGSAVVLHATFPPPSGNGEHGAVLGLYTSAEARFLRAGWKAVDEA